MLINVHEDHVKKVGHAFFDVLNYRKSKNQETQIFEFYDSANIMFPA